MSEGKANDAAHKIAKNALFLMNEVVHIEEVPQYINDIVVISKHLV